MFAASIDTAKWEIYLACLSDLAVYAAASVAARANGGFADPVGLAEQVFKSGLTGEKIPADRPDGFAAAETRFAERVKAVDWTAAADKESAFAGSLAALVEWAPIADELKRYDVQAVRNSLRFQWKAVRDELDRLLDADAVAAAWRDGQSNEL